jgi:acyl-CoA thioesterase-1
LAWAVPEATDAVILELGANDALRGLDPTRAKANLDRIMTTVKAGGAEILLAGMIAPRNLGPDYSEAFNGMYAELAKKHGAVLYPFFLDGVALNAGFNLGDGIHPNAKGVAEIVKRIMPAVDELLARTRARPTAPKG